MVLCGCDRQRKKKGGKSKSVDGKCNAAHFSYSSRKSEHESAIPPLTSVGGFWPNVGVF